MKPALVLASTAALAAFAAPSLASAQDVEIRHAVARVAVVIEDRSDVAVEVEQGRSGLPPVRVSRVDGQLRVDGGLRRRSWFGGDNIRSCNNGPGGGRAGEGASAEVRGLGRIRLEDAPLIVIRTPRRVDLKTSGAVFGSVGRGATSVELGNGGCGAWDVANVAGPLSLSIGGSGEIRTGTSRTLDVAIGGSGSVTAGSTGGLDVAIGGSGDVVVARIDGDMDVSIGGSGDVQVRQGSAPKVDVSIAGAGDVAFGGVAGDVSVSIMGSGDVDIARATGSVSRSIVGGGEVRIGS